MYCAPSSFSSLVIPSSPRPPPLSPSSSPTPDVGARGAVSPPRHHRPSSAPDPLPQAPRLALLAPCCHSSQSRPRPLPIRPMRTPAKHAIRSQRCCHASTAASASGQLVSNLSPGLEPPGISSSLVFAMPYIGLHCTLILGVWSTYKGTREPIPRKSLSPVAGLDVGRRLDDGEHAFPSFLSFVLDHPLLPHACARAGQSSALPKSPVVPPIPDTSCGLPQSLLPSSFPLVLHHALSRPSNWTS